MLTDINRFFRFGKQGAGAPLRDENGAVIATRQNFTNAIPHLNSSEHDISYIPPPTGEIERSTMMNSRFNNSRDRAKTHSPSQLEMVHMRPSNMFSDITEEEFNRKERNKAEYRKEL